MATERWLPAVGWEGLYEVSDQGRVKSLSRKVRHYAGGYRTTSERILSGSVMANGYHAVSLHGAQHKRETVHRLVATAFLGSPTEGQEVRHLDGVRSNNAAVNLAWGTRSENNRDKALHGTDHQLNKTHCPQGHPYSLENTYVKPNGARCCRTCKRAQQDAWKSANRDHWNAWRRKRRAELRAAGKKAS